MVELLSIEFSVHSEVVYGLRRSMRVNFKRSKIQVLLCWAVKQLSDKTAGIKFRLKGMILSWNVYFEKNVLCKNLNSVFDFNMILRSECLDSFSVLVLGIQAD